LKIKGQVLTNSKDQFYSLLQTIEGIAWEAEADTLRFTFVSNHVKQILGFSPQDWLKQPHFWEDHIHPDDREKVLNYYSKRPQRAQSRSFEYRMVKADGSVVWIKDVFSIISEAGAPTLLRGLMLDTTMSRRLSDLEHLEQTVLELNSKNGVPFREVLSCYLTGVEALFPKMLCSILHVRNSRLYNWSSPSLPKPYVEAIENLPISAQGGSCGTAAFLKQKVIVTDIENDPRWANYKHLALIFNLRACWSHPVINSDGEVMATLGMYYHEPRIPDEDELKVIERVTALFKIILENTQKSEIINESNLLMAQSEELAHFGNWRWDVQNNLVTWSDTLYAIYDLNKNDFKATFEARQELLHPADRQRVYDIITGVLRTKEKVEFEERIIRPSGEIRYLKSWGMLKSDANGMPVAMIGACLDVTDSRKTKEALKATASRLKALVDAETNYVIRVNLDGKYTYCNKKYRQDFDWILYDKNLADTDASITIQPYHHDLVKEITRNCVENPDRVFQVDVDKIQKDGSTKPTRWQFIGLTNSKGETFEIQCIGQDITDLKNAENELRISNERYEYVNKVSNDAIFSWDIVTGNVKWGDGFFRLFGFDVNEDYTFEKWKLQVHPSDINKTEASLLGSIADHTQSNWTGEYRFRRADGMYANVEGNGYIIRDETGRGIRMIGLLRDITERLNYLKAIENQNEQLREIAWMQSHGVRAPLAKIMGLIDLIKNYPNNDIEKSQLLGYLLTSANELDDVVRTISKKTEHIELKASAKQFL